MVILVIALDRTMHTAINLLLLNLCLSDIMYVTITIPFNLAMEICNNRWPFSEIWGKIFNQVPIIVFTSSALTLMAVAFER